MGNRRLVEVLAACSASLLLLSGCGSSTPSSQDRPSGSAGTADASLAAMLPDDIRSAGQITVGAELTVPPMIFFEQDGTTMAGVNYELAQAMGKELGVKIVFKQYDFSGLQPALNSGKIKAIFDVINDTKAREQQFDFVDYVTAGNTLLLQSGNPANITSLTDMCGQSMSTVRGSVQIALVQAASTACTGGKKAAITINQYPSASDARLAIQTGKNTAFIGNTPVLVYLARTAGEGKTFSAVPISGETSYYGIAVSKADSQLRDALHAAVKKIISDGTYAKVLDKYGLSVIAVSEPKVNGATS